VSTPLGSPLISHDAKPEIIDSPLMSIFEGSRFMVCSSIAIKGGRYFVSALMALHGQLILQDTRAKIVHGPLNLIIRRWQQNCN